MFRDDFVWGVASSAYQIEGRDPQDGAGKCIWDTFAEEGRVYGHQNADVACDHIHRYKEDFAMMRLLGVKAYRFSLSWARLMPEGTGAVNEKAVALYRDYPYTDKPEDVEAAKSIYFGFDQPIENWTWNVAWFADPVFLGTYPAEGLEKYRVYLPEITEADLELIHQPIDFIGQNIYNGYYIRRGADGRPEYVDRPAGFPKTAANWPVTPECLYWGTKFLYERYHMPLYITENGMSCHDIVSADGQVHDSNRIEFLDRYLSQLQKAGDEGADIRGYFLWTFLDNFEWDKGYNERFGIVYVDFATQKCTAKDSAYWYQ